MSLLISPRDMDFVLYELLDAESFTQSDIYSDLDRDTFNAVIDTAKKLAEDKFEPFAAKLDANEPTFDGKVVHIIPEVKDALDAYVEAGFMGIAADTDYGGMQLPWVIAQAACAYIAAADISANAYPFLTHAAINLLSAYASKSQKDLYMKPLIEGRFFGTMCLSEPQAGSSLSDIKVKAEKKSGGYYSISGTKMWISAGEHELSENIIHLVLAKIPGADLGVRGISLFIVPKYRVNDDGGIGDRNNIELAGLNHKMGFRGTTNTVLNFGEHGECQGFLVGEEHQGLFYMFHMMNEARIGIGMTATVLGYSGYLHSLDYARNRPQGRAIGQKDPTSSQIPIIEHADIKRLLLAQKSAVEASLFLVLYCASLLDRQKASRTENEKTELLLLLDILTPIAKSWPSEFCLEANKHAIQILGGYGYTRDFPLERFYRDNRLNPIHEGTHGIQGIDLLGRKVIMQDGAALKVLFSAYQDTINSAEKVEGLDFYVESFSSAIQKLDKVTSTLVSPESGSILERTANATIYLDAFGHIVISWMWLRQVEVAIKELTGSESDFYNGKMQAAEYFFRYELPKAIERLEFLEKIDTTCIQTENDWF